MNVEICEVKIIVRNFCSILIKLAQKTRFKLLTSSCKFHKILLLNKVFFSIRPSIDFNIEAQTGWFHYIKFVLNNSFFCVSKA